jgi:peptide-methionine (S)-S-oxide reductase
VEVVFDPDEVSYPDLVAVFFGVHDPTQVDRQGPDVGTQYRSAIFVHAPDQREKAEAAREALAERLGRAIATEITDAVTFFPAQDYHQQYLARRGRGACASTLES